MPNETMPQLAPSTYAVVRDDRTVDYDEITREIADAQGRIDRIKEELGMGNKKTSNPVNQTGQAVQRPTSNVSMAEVGGS